MHDMNDISMGGPERVDRCLLSPSKSVTRVILVNTSLPPDVRSYTLTLVSNDYEITKHLILEPDPKWFEQLKNSVK